MNWAALGALQLTELALAFIAAAVFYRTGKRDGVEEHLNEQRERRSERRAEMRMAPQGRHHLTAFPGDDRGDEAWLEKLATTGELRLYAEQGDMNRVRSEVAAFWSRLTLSEWSRKRAGAA